MSWFEEFLVVLAYSQRTQWAIGLGMVSFVVILTVGDYFAGHLSLQGMFAPLSDAVREALLGRYDKSAWSSLGAFLLLAVKCYRKDRKRLLAL
jgi:Na+-transporting NADH:ubiquinone oxidoreductase subunit NqrE